MDGLLTELFQELNKAVNYAVLRNFNDLPRSIGNDLDVLIHPNDILKAEEIVNRVASNNGFSIFKIVRRFRYNGFYMFNEKHQDFVLIDLFTGLCKGWRCYADAEKVLNRKVWLEGFYALKETDEMSTIICKELLTYGIVRSKYKKRFEEIFGTKSFSFSKCDFNLLTKKSQFKLYSQEGNEQLFEGITIKIKSNDWSNILPYLFFRLKAISMQIFGKRTLIALIGPDGVGKSTLSARLSGFLEKNSLFSEVKVYHHRFDILPQLSRFDMRRKTSLESNSPAGNSDDIIHGRLRTFVYMVYYGLDYILGYFVLFSNKCKGGAVIFDRYVYDFYIQKSYRKVSWSTKRFYEALIPKPNIVVFLYANPHVVVNRKNELSLKEHIEQNEVCLNLLRDNQNRALFCNCNMDIEKSVSKLNSLVLKKLFQ